MTEVCMANDIVRETEKAICFDYAGERMVWLPKSCIAIVDGVVWAKNWIARQNGIGRYNQTRVLL
jgi:hypothetical protein